MTEPPHHSRAVLEMELGALQRVVAAVCAERGDATCSGIEIVRGEHDRSAAFTECSYLGVIDAPSDPRLADRRDPQRRFVAGIPATRSEAGEPDIVVISHVLGGLDADARLQTLQKALGFVEAGGRVVVIDDLIGSAGPKRGRPQLSADGLLSLMLESSGYAVSIDDVAVLRDTDESVVATLVAFRILHSA